MFRQSIKLREPETTLRRAVHELKRKGSANKRAWGYGNTERWDADLNKGVLIFTDPGQIVTTRVQVIGSYYAVDRTWLWAWDHPSIPEALAYDARLARAFGERHRLWEYKTRMVTCTEDEAWQFTALAHYLAGAAGGYRGPSGDTYVFMTFHDVRIERTG